MRQKTKNLIPIIVLLVFSCETIYYYSTKTYYSQGELTHYFLRVEQLYGFIALVINIIVWQIFSKYFKFTIGLTLLLGWINVLVFGAFKRTTGVGICGLNIVGQPGPMLATLLAIILNYKELKLFFNKPETEEEVNFKKERAKESQKEEVKIFENNFISYSTKELNDVLNDNRYIETAKIAAKNILSKKSE